MTGKQISHYEILDKIGEGGMGAVWKARDRVLDRLVAIKVLPAGKAATEERRQRFFQEAKAASALNHPNIVTIYEAGRHENEDYLVMELIKGRTLADCIGKSGMKLSEALRCASQIAGALEAAHAAGIVHRDLKPGNVMITDTGLVKVLDFGLAKLTETAPASEDDATRTALARTEEGTVMGTAAYMSPEQALGKPVDSRSDIFSLGAVLYETMTGQRAFEGPNKLSTLSAIVEKEPAPLPTPVPREVERIIARCLRKDPARRWQTMADLRMSLDEVREDTESGRVSALGVAAAPARKTRTMAIAAGIGALVLGAAAAAWFLRPGAGPGPEVTVVPFTSFPGAERAPTFSPDGNQIAFQWDGPNQDNHDIYVKLIGPGAPLRLTTDPAPDGGPAWSPDGKWIAFVRNLPKGRAVMAVPPLGGLERKVAEFDGILSVAWTPDSRWVVFHENGQPGITMVSFESGERKRLTAHFGGKGSYSPAYSPSGTMLAFYQDSLPSFLMVGAASPSGELTEPPRTLLSQRYAYHAAWTPDGAEIVSPTSFNENSILMRLAADGKSAGRPLHFAGAGAIEPAIALKGDRMAFSRYLREVNLYGFDVDAGNAPTGPPKAVFESSKSEYCPRFSPDGKYMAFESNRSGDDEIWICTAAGEQCRQLTSFGGPHAGSPAWSPDGEWIAFDGTKDGEGSVYVVRAGGGQPRRAGRGSAPRWSPDGKWIVFGQRGGAVRVPAQGGDPVAVRGGGGCCEFSTDGRYLYCSSSPGTGASPLWRVPVDGGEREPVLPEVSGRNFAVTAQGIWYIVAAREKAELRFHDFRTKASRLVYAIPKPVYAGITVAPDGRRIVWNQLDQSGADLMLVENFR